MHPAFALARQAGPGGGCDDGDASVVWGAVLANGGPTGG
jgi:hypothetical protein